MLYVMSICKLMMRNFSCFLITHFNFSLSNFTELSSFVWLLQLSSPSLLSSATCVHSFVSFVIIQDWSLLLHYHRKLIVFSCDVLNADSLNYLHRRDYVKPYTNTHSKTIPWSIKCLQILHIINKNWFLGPLFWSALILLYQYWT